MLQLTDVIKERILLLDGAMGTMIQAYKLTEEDFRSERFANLPGQQKGNNDLLILTRPDIISEIHTRYLQAGADIIETNTFSSQRISMADYGCEHLCRELNLEGARLARACADQFSTPEKPRFVAGSVGPTNRTCSMSPDVNDPALRLLTYDELVSAYQEQMEVLIEGGVDALLLETIFDTLNLKAGLYAAEEAMRVTGRRVPIMLSMTVADLSGRTLSGQSIKAFLASIEHAPIFSVGLNCSFGASEMKPFLEELAAEAPYYISCYPNAGLPNSLGEYDQSAEEMTAQVQAFLDEGLLNILGGCCGTTDEYIASFGERIAVAKPHVPVSNHEYMWLSGLDRLVASPEINFLNIGERCNVAGSRKFLRLIKEGNYIEACDIARKQVEDGAQIIDINMDDGLLDASKEMTHFLNILASEPDVARIPFMIDSSKWEVIEAGLKCVQGKCIVNSISLKEGEEAFLDHAAKIRQYGAAVVVMAFDEEGQASTYNRRIEICSRAYRLLIEKLNFPPQDIIFDPNVLAICTGMAEHNDYAREFIEATRWIRTNLPGAHVSGGVSNLSFSFRGNTYLREAMHSVFLYHAIQAGMDMGIVNPSTAVLYEDIPKEQLQLIEDVILNRRDASEELIALAEQLQGQQTGGETKNKQDEWRKKPVEERLEHAIIKGISTHLNEDLHELLPQYPHAVNIIEGPLMRGMNIVGDLFGAGKMFLPQVIKTARTMKAAVAILQPYIEAERVVGQSSVGKALMATVKGDVHDIGKNIVGVVLGCNNYEIIDLGIMTPADKIVKTAIDEQVDFIGLSGLITPSLEEMVITAKALNEAGVNCPICIGGATTSALHTALKIAPVYDGPVIYVKDASQMVITASRFMNEETKDDFFSELATTQADLREKYNGPRVKTISLNEARNKKLQLF